MPGYARVCVDVRPAHLDRLFDYAVDGHEVDVGQRVVVDFAGRRRTGWVLELAATADTPEARVKPLHAVAGPIRWLAQDDVAVARWVARRWAAPLADVLRHALPPRLAGLEEAAASWPAPAGLEQALRPPCPSPAWRDYDASALLRATAGRAEAAAFWLRPLPDEDPAALLVDLLARTVAAGRRALVLTPDPASPLAAAALAFAGPDGADLRAAQADRDRTHAALRCRLGHATVAVGERSAALTPLPDLGLIVVEDEANPAYKERRSPRHHARDVALGRARLCGANAVLFGDVPSAALWRLLERGHVTAVRGHRTVERARAPRIDVVDLADPRPRARTRLSTDATRALREVVAQKTAAIVLASRRGEGTALACSGCGTRIRCPSCDGSVRDGPQGLRACTACGSSSPSRPCAQCGGTTTAPLAAGVARLRSELQRTLPEAEVAAMEGFNAEGPATRPAVAVMTRGSVVARPPWLAGERAAVCVVPDADALRARPTIDAAEDALRLWMAAARVADRMVLQTREPASAAVQALVRWDPEGFWRREAAWRAPLGFPPVRSLIAVRPGAEAAATAAELTAALTGYADVLGPDADGGLLLLTDELTSTLDLLTPLRHAWSRAGRRVVVDVDPLDAG